MLTEFQIHGNTVAVRPGSLLPRSIWDMDAVNCSHEQNGFSFEFAALSYANPQKTRYRFKLEGLETQWTERTADTGMPGTLVSSRGSMSFVYRHPPTVGPGGSKEPSLRLTIAPPWWKTPWTKGASLLFQSLG